MLKSARGGRSVKFSGSRRSIVLRGTFLADIQQTATFAKKSVRPSNTCEMTTYSNSWTMQEPTSESNDLDWSNIFYSCDKRVAAFLRMSCFGMSTLAAGSFDSLTSTSAMDSATWYAA